VPSLVVSKGTPPKPFPKRESFEGVLLKFVKPNEVRGEQWLCNMENRKLTAVT
jgi:hypothetical protein